MAIHRWLNVIGNKASTIVFKLNILIIVEDGMNWQGDFQNVISVKVHFVIHSLI